MLLEHFQYGVGAVILDGQRDAFVELRDRLVAETRPATFAEQLVVDQMLHAQWELHRVRILSNHVEAEESLHAAFNRASRNWQRALRQLTAMQTAQASKYLCVTAHDQTPDGVPPLANLAAIPRRIKDTRDFQQWHDDLYIAGYSGPASFDACNDTEPVPEAN